MKFLTFKREQLGSFQTSFSVKQVFSRIKILTMYVLFCVFETKMFVKNNTKKAAENKVVYKYDTRNKNEG